MAGFAIEEFLGNPSVERLDHCRKDDLFAIATHFGVSFSKSMVKAELKEAVMRMLVDMNVLIMDDGASVVSSPSPHYFPGKDQVAIEEAVGGESVIVGASEIEFKPPRTVPKFTPLSAGRSSGDARLRLRLARLQFEAQEKERDAEYSHRLAVRKMELDMELRIKQLELEASAKALSLAQPSPMPVRGFEVSRNVALAPPFCEVDVDSYFRAFERVATSLEWPTEVWAILLQCKLTGKAQDILSSLSLEDSLSYEAIKTAVLRAYELVPEAYRQKFRAHKKLPGKTFVEFAREKEALFKRWCTASNVLDFNSLSELMLLEEFKNSLSDHLVTYLNEQKVVTLAQAAVLADEFVLTHKQTFGTPRNDSRIVLPFVQTPPKTQARPPRPLVPHYKEERECYYCHQMGHIKNDYC